MAWFVENRRLRHGGLSLDFKKQFNQNYVKIYKFIYLFIYLFEMHFYIAAYKIEDTPNCVFWDFDIKFVFLCV